MTESILNKISKRVWWKLLYHLPVKQNKIVVRSMGGLGYLDNSKYVVRELLRRGGDYQIYWLLRDMDADNGLPEGVHPVKVNSLKGIYHMCTARVWINNNRKWAYERKKPSQLYIQLWHGSMALKKIEADAEDKLEPAYVQAAKLDSKDADIIVSGTAANTEIIRRAFWYDGPVLQVGNPRTDILFEDISELREKICDKYGIPADKKLILYAPTFRADYNTEVYELDHRRILDCLSEKFGGSWFMLVRMHPNLLLSGYRLELPDCAVDVTRYFDMQELLGVSDALLTDYSSCMFDMGYVLKPCFLYTPDRETYDRGTYYSLDELPFPYADTMDQLRDIIQNYSPEDYCVRVRDFNENVIGSFEKGSASAAVADYIENAIG
ncbi:MAG: CDP-glycerol glycerophosphotransferase family protein [Oscillospiraceae bacterium]|nr:CDP-glycerol glycerophosphotransferase family protein [Oscillospiraceae bacterium]